MAKAPQKIVLILLGLLVAGCTTTVQKPNPDLFYKRDLKMKVNGVQGTGLLVVPRAEKYRVFGESSGKLDLLTLTSCHREHSSENEGLDFEYDYKPNPGIEDSDACPIKIEGNEKKKGRHSWGFIDFEGPDAILPATVQCNGSTSKANGVSACQSRADLIQVIEFDQEVRVWPDKGCELNGKPGEQRGKRFEFKIRRGECVYAFLEAAGQGRWHRLTTLGYEAILIREE